MKISIITATYNSESTVRDTINSVLAQDYDDIEYIIVDGNSNDRTTEIVRSYGNKISKFISEPDDGIYDALNKGISMATGEVIGFLHSDDTYLGNDILSSIAEAFSSGDADCCYGDLVYTKNGDPGKVIRHWKAGTFRSGRIRFGWMPPHPTFFARKRIYEKHGAFDTGFRISADYENLLRILLNGDLQIKYLPFVLIAMRTGGTSNRNFRNILIKSAEDAKALRHNKVHVIPALIFKNITKIKQFIIPSRIRLNAYLSQ